MRETITKDISGVTYHIQQLGARQGRSIMTRLIRVVGPALGETEDLDLTKLFEALKEEDVEALCEAFAKTTRVVTGTNKERVLGDIFDDHFAGKYGAMIKWVIACLEVNFGSFLAEVRDLAPVQPPEAPKA